MFPRRPSNWHAVRAWLAVFSLILLGGCQSLELSREEMTWQALHAVDIAQTLSAADDPCYQEDAWLTQKLIGKQPSEAEVLAWGVGTAVGHALITHSLEAINAPKWVQKAWGYTTISYSAYTIVDNHDNGVRAFGDNKDVAGCYR